MPASTPSTAPSRLGITLEPARPEPLPQDGLRVLAKRAARHEGAAYDHRRRLEGHDRTLADLAMRQDELSELIRQAEARLARATRTLDQHDRPLRRRGHTTEIAGAKNEANALPDRIEALSDELAKSPAAAEAERAPRDRTETRYRLFHGRDAERVKTALADDARNRSERLAEDPPQLLVEHLGPVPTDPTTRDRWITAAGRVDQHRSLWDLPDSTLVGTRPPVGQPDYGITYYAANRAIADLEEVVETRGPEVRRLGPGYHCDCRALVVGCSPAQSSARRGLPGATTARVIGQRRLEFRPRRCGRRARRHQPWNDPCIRLSIRATVTNTCSTQSRTPEVRTMPSFNDVVWRP